MRAKSKNTDGYIVYAVSGTNTVSFAIDFRKANTVGLLGFAVERINKAAGERKFMDGYKVFKDVVKNPDENTVVNTYSHPIQSFVWDDFACYEATEYEYLFYPLKGNPKELDRTARPIAITIRTEALFSKNEHDVFFNRGVASSQAYRKKFINLPPDKILDEKIKKQALDWLSRKLDEAIFKFINDAKAGETLLGCFYEFHYLPVVKAFAEAIKRGVNVKLIVDAKNNKRKDNNGKEHQSFPREVNLKTLADAGLSIAQAGNVILREARKDAIQHNKFIVLLDKKGKAKQVWTGSTNISMGGIHGQTNVGHWVKNAKAAQQFEAYWNILSVDPGGKDSDDKPTRSKKDKELRAQVEKLQPNIKFETWNDIPAGITCVFSPRSGLDILETYARMFDNAKDIACITLAFGINNLFKDYIEDNKSTGHISFMLLEKEDKPSKNSKTKFRYIGAKQNVYKASGAYIEDSLYNWTKETSTRALGLNMHVAYIHSKFLLIDPLGADPVIVTGSANFSKPSTNDNDENMIIIRGDKRAADIYFTEFNRLFNHYYFRFVYNNAKENKRTDEGSLILSPDDTWLSKYEEGKLRYKRVEMFTKMKGFAETIDRPAIQVIAKEQKLL